MSALRPDLPSLVLNSNMLGYFHCSAMKLVTQNGVLGPKQMEKFSPGKGKHRVLCDGSSSQLKNLGFGARGFC